MSTGARITGRSLMSGRFDDTGSIGSTSAHMLLNSDGAPADGERTIFVSDDGMLDTGEFDQLSAEFRFRLGLLPEEEQELSEVFKVRIGLASADRDQFDRLADEIDRAMSDSGPRREETIRKNNMELFARKYFQPQSPPLQYNQKPLKRPLLPKTDDVEKRASLLLWMAIKRFMDGTTQRKASNAGKGLEVPIISRVWDLLESRPVVSSAHQKAGGSMKRQNSAGNPYNVAADNVSSSDRKSSLSSSSSLSSKRLSLKKLFRANSSSTSTISAAGGADVIRDPVSRTQSLASSTSSSSDGGSVAPQDGGDRPTNDASSGKNEVEEDNTNLLTADIVDSIPNTELDLVNYIVAHGILRKELRDEIYSQLCCLVTKNPSADSRRRGWILHALCAGSFLPSIELCSYYYGFLYDVLLSDTLHYAAYTRRILRRTNANGMRFHPPSSIELKVSQTNSLSFDTRTSSAIDKIPQQLANDAHDVQILEEPHKKKFSTKIEVSNDSELKNTTTSSLDRRTLFSAVQYTHSDYISKIVVQQHQQVRHWYHQHSFYRRVIL